MSRANRFFDDPRCSCPDVVDVVRAGIEGRELRLCELHQADEIKARAADAARAADEEYRARYLTALDEIRAPRQVADPMACTCPELKELAMLTLAGNQPECPEHNAPVSTQVDSAGTIALNDDEALARSFGMTLSKPEQDLPPTAA
jgi:hypothetical protein